MTLAAYSSDPSVTEWMSVVAPPTSTTRTSPSSSANSSAPLSTAPGVGRIPWSVSSANRAIPGARVMCRLNTSWMSTRSGSTSSTSTSGKTLSATISSTPCSANARATARRAATLPA